VEHTPLSGPAIHEQFDRSAEPRPASDRAFGLGLSLPLALLGSVRWLRGGEPRWWALGASLLLAFVAIARPSLLHPLALVWTRGLRPVHRAVTLAVMGLFFILAITPVGLLRRLLVRDPLQLRIDPAAPTYWRDRRPPGPAPESMSNQF
jgi:hypothetical protein